MCLEVNLEVLELEGATSDASIIIEPNTTSPHPTPYPKEGPEKLRITLALAIKVCETYIFLGFKCIHILSSWAILIVRVDCHKPHVVRLAGLGLGGPLQALHLVHWCWARARRVL